MTSKKRIESRLARLVNRNAEDIGHREMEMLLQTHAQAMREQQEPDITLDDIEGYKNAE